VTAGSAAGAAGAVGVDLNGDQIARKHHDRGENRNADRRDDDEEDGGYDPPETVRAGDHIFENGT
jgi:hypothetical protein